MSDIRGRLGIGNPTLPVTGLEICHTVRHTLRRVPSLMMIVLFIVLARNKLRIPLEGTYSREM